MILNWCGFRREILVSSALLIGCFDQCLFVSPEALSFAKGAEIQAEIFRSHEFGQPKFSAFFRVVHQFRSQGYEL